MIGSRPSKNQTGNVTFLSRCQQVKKIAKIAEDISRESQGTLALIIDEFQKTGADPILVRIVSGTHQGNIVLLSSHNSAISIRSYATMAIRILGAFKQTTEK